MPPFRLELPDRRPNHSRSLQLIYTKNTYSEGVKSRGWNERLEYKPIENAPLCAGSLNHFQSHYKRFGIDAENRFKTTTDEALKQVYTHKKKFPAPKLVANYYTFDDSCGYETNGGLCDGMLCTDYVTTMQRSYELPKPYEMRRLAFPKIPFMENRRFKMEDPRASTCKFYDDNFHFGACHLQKYNGKHYDSYNFMTGKYGREERNEKQ